MLLAVSMGRARALKTRGRSRLAMRRLRRSHFCRVLEFSRNASVHAWSAGLDNSLIHENADVSSFFLRQPATAAKITLVYGLDKHRTLAFTGATSVRKSM